MKNKNKLTLLQEILIILLALYFSFCITWNPNSQFNILSWLLIFIVSYIPFRLLLPKLFSFKLKSNGDNFKRKELWIYGIIIFAILFGILLTLNHTILHADTIGTMKQAQLNEYSNWHPIIYTLLFFKLPTMIFNDYISCDIIQLILIGIVLLYFCYFLRKYFFDKKMTILILLLILLNPVIIEMSMTLVKDVPFTWCMFLATLFIIEIVFTKGEWMNKTSHKVIFILSLMGIFFFRHNGIANVFLILLFLAILFKEKRIFYVVVGIVLIASRFILYGPVYNQLDIDPAGDSFEMIGIPMNQVAYIYHQNVYLTKEEQEMFDRFVGKETWERYYNPTNFNLLKWGDGDIRHLYKKWIDSDFDNIMKFWATHGLKYPKLYLYSYLNVTSTIWKIKPTHTLDSAIQKPANNQIINTLRKAFIGYSDTISASPLHYVFFNVGMGLFIIIVALAIVISKCRKDYKKYLPFVLVLSNTLVIMCLITGDETRFIYSQAVCAIPLLIYALSLNSKVKRSDKNEHTNKQIVHKTN